MKILYFSTGYGPHDFRFLSALARTRHHVHFLRLLSTGQRAESRPVPASIRELDWASAPKVFRWGDVPRLVLELRRIIRHVGPDLIHAGPIQTCAFLGVLAGLGPVLTMSWGFDLMQDADRNAWWRWVTRYTLRRSSFFVSDANVTRARAVDFGMPPDRIAVFPWGVDLRVFKPAASPSTNVHSQKREARAGDSQRRRVARQPRRPMVLLCNRSWEPRYGVDVLARAFGLAAKADNSLRLVLLGRGSQARQIRQILKSAGVLNRVKFGGHVAYSSLPRWYHRADVFVSPSHVDGSSVSLMEALASGVPALVSDIPANKEWVRNGLNGWLFRDGDAIDLSKRILWVSGKRRLLRHAGMEARGIAEERADWDRNFGVLLQAYESTLRLPQKRGNTQQV